LYLVGLAFQSTEPFMHFHVYEIGVEMIACLLFYCLSGTLAIWISVRGLRRGNWWNRLLCGLDLLLFTFVVVLPLAALPLFPGK
jgi:hypothetical protein